MRAEVTIAARYPEYKPAPVSGIATQEIYTLFGSAVASARGTRRLIGVAAQGMTASPDAQRLVAERSRERLAADGFTDDQIAAILEAVPIATHDQRGLGTLHLGLPEECDTDVDAADLLAIVEDSMSSEIYELMKRSDEGAVVEKAHRRPRFVEDCVDEAIRGALERYGDLRDDVFVSARQENFESIHQHSVVAERFGLLGELRRDGAVALTRRCASGSAQPDAVGAVDPEVVERGAARVAHAQALDERARSARPPGRRPAPPRRARRRARPATRTGATCASRAASASTTPGARRPVSEDLARSGRADRQRERGLGRALLQGEPSLASRSVARVTAASAPPLNTVSLRQRGAEQVRHLRVQRTARPRPDRPGRAAEPVDDAPAVDGKRGAERAAELEHHERGLGEVDAEPLRLVGDAQRDARDLVRGTEVDAVPLAVRRDGRQMDRARAEHERSPAAISARTIERIPPTPTRPCGSSSRTSSISASSRSPTCSTGTSGSP